MKLSEAIRLGAMLRPQSFAGLREHRGRGNKIAVCALGGALEAAGVRIRAVRNTSASVDCRTGKRIEGAKHFHWDWPPEWKDTLRIFCASPCEPFGLEWLYRIIPRLNDKHRWSRERIADWVETIEREHEAAKAHEPGVPIEVSV